MKSVSVLFIKKMEMKALALKKLQKLVNFEYLYLSHPLMEKVLQPVILTTTFFVRINVYTCFCFDIKVHILILTPVVCHNKNN